MNIKTKDLLRLGWITEVFYCVSKPGVEGIYIDLGEQEESMLLDLASIAHLPSLDRFEGVSQVPLTEVPVRVPTLRAKP